MANILHVVYRNIDQSLENSHTTAMSLAMTVNDNGIPEDFENTSRQLMASNPGIDGVQLVPDGIIKYIYPLKGHEAALGLNILTTPDLQQEAFKAMNLRKMYFAGPFKLRQGGMGILGRLPVFKDNKFWGFSVVLIRLETLLKFSGINMIENSKYYFQLSKINPLTNKEEFFFPENKDISERYYESQKFPEGDWKLYVVSQNKYYIYLELLPGTFLGLLLVGSIGIFIAMLLKKPAELQMLVQQQTRKLLSTEVKFKAIFDHAAIGIANIDSITGQFIEVNEQYCQITGYMYDELLSMPFTKLSHPNEFQFDLTQMKKLQSGKAFQFSAEKRLIKKNGDTVWVALSVSPLRRFGTEPNTHIAIISDISKTKEAENDLTKSLTLVTEQNKRLRNFSYIVSHNLRSHTANMQSIINLIDLADSDEEKNELLALLQKVSLSLNETMHHLNDLLNIQSNVAHIAEQLQLNKYIKNTLGILSEQITAIEVKVINNVPDEAKVNYNPAYLESVLLNLISNAIRYRNPSIQLIIKLGWENDNGFGILSVTDNGIGIDLSRHGERLFGMFKTFHGNPDARGIGLFITRNQVEAMGGSISAESELMKGTTFKVIFR